MRKGIVKKGIIVVFAISLLVSASMVTQANNYENTNTQENMAVEPRASYIWSEAPFYGTKSLDYNRYVTMRNRSQAFDNAIISISGGVMSGFISAITGLGGKGSKQHCKWNY